MRPLRNLVLVRRVTETVTEGGILIPQTFVAEGPAQRIAAKREHWRGEVLAVGPEVRELAPGDHVLVYTWAADCDGTHESLYTGVDVGEGRRLVAWPDDLVCAVDVHAVSEAAE